MFINGRKVTWRSALMALTHVAVLSFIVLVQVRIVFPTLVFMLNVDYPGVVPGWVEDLAMDLFPFEAMDWLPTRRSTPPRC